MYDKCFYTSAYYSMLMEGLLKMCFVKMTWESVDEYLEMIRPTIFLEFCVPTSKVVCLKKELLPLHIPNKN